MTYFFYLTLRRNKGKEKVNFDSPKNISSFHAGMNCILSSCGIYQIPSINKFPSTIDYFSEIISQNFAKITGKHLRRSLFLINIQVAVLKLYQKEIPAQVFPREFGRIFQSSFYKGHMLTNASE